MEESNFTKMIEEILKNGGVNIDGLNFFGNFQSNVVSYLEMSHLLLSKLSCVTFFDFTEDLIKDENFNLKEEEQVKFLNEINEQIKTMYSIARKQIVKNFVVVRIMKKKMDELLKGAPGAPKKDFTDLLNFVENGLNPPDKDIDTDIFGGGPRTNQIIELLFLFFLFFSIIIPIKNANVELLPDSEGEQTEITYKLEPITMLTSNDIVTYNKGIIEMDMKEYAKSMKSTPRQATEHVDINQMVVKHDKNTEKKLETMFGFFKEMFSPSETGVERMEKIVDTLNTEFAFLSREFEQRCLSLMDDARDNGVFSIFKSSNTLKQTEEKIKSAQKQILEINNNIGQQITDDLTGVAGSLLAMDTASLTTYLYSIGMNVAEYLTYNNTESTALLEEQESVNREFESSFTTEADKNKFEENLSKYSKIYCSYGFHLELKLEVQTNEPNEPNETNEMNIKIIGDKVPYQFLSSFIRLLRKNIEHKMRTIIDDRTEDSKKIMMFLNSLNQRLSILDLVIVSNDDLINYFGHNKIYDIVNQPNAMNNFEDYFNLQISNLKTMLQKLGEVFPLFNEHLQRERDIALASKASQVLEQEIKDINANATSFVERQKAERHSKQNREWYTDLTIYWGSYYEIGKNATRSLTEGAVETFGDTVVIGPLRGVLKVLNSMLYELITTPSGWFLIMIGMFSFLYLLSSIKGTIWFFTRGTVSFFVFVWGCFVFIYKVIITPFGFIYRHVRTIFVPPQPQPQLEDRIQRRIDYDGLPENKDWYNRVLKRDELNENDFSFDDNTDWKNVYYKTDRRRRDDRGGKLRKYKKTRKNKMRITKKKGKGKKRYTRNKNRRKSKKN